jgi:Flp pilus assembly CpaE family ATPase
VLSIFDLGRGLTPDSLELLEEMDEIYLATIYDVPSLHQAKSLTHCLLDRGFTETRLRLIINRRPRHMDLTLDEIGKMLGTSVYAVIRDEAEELDEAYTAGRLVGHGTSLGRAIEDLVQKMTDPGHAAEKRSSFLGL